MLLQMRCIIINPVLNNASKNKENDTLKKLKEKDKDYEKPPQKDGSRFIH